MTTSKVKAKSASKKLARRNPAKTDFPKLKPNLLRPQRKSYVRRGAEPQGCVFCEALQQGIETRSLLLKIDSDAMVVVNKYPYNSGHLLVLPTRHVAKLSDLTVSEQTSIQRVLAECERVLTKAYSPHGFNIGLNLGSAAGAGLPAHLHWHFIPRWNGDTNFFPLIGNTKVVIEAPEDTYKKLHKYFAQGGEKKGDL